MIVENLEPLVQIKPIQKRLFIDPIYFKQRIVDSLQVLYLRKQAYERLVQAAQLLPANYSLIVYDGFRPLQVQQALYEKIKREILLKYPHFSQTEVEQQTLKYVAYPSIEPNFPAPHLTGGAVDVTLGDLNGNPLDLGTEFDETSSKSATTYFEQHLMENKEALNNRRLLFHVMTHAGFQNYEEEWWHYDFGNVTWARKSNEKHAIYGPIIASIHQHELKEYRFK